MIWHIIKKDLRLLWPAALVSIGLSFVLTWVYARAGLFYDPPALRNLAPFLSIVCDGAAILSAILVVQQDVVAGVRGDWLSRPIKRADLLLAKSLFIVLTIGMPRLIMSFGLALFQDHDVATALLSAVVSAGATLITILPFFAVATLAENLTQTILTAFGLIICVVIAYLVSDLTHGIALEKTGAVWIRNTVATVVAVGVGVAVLLLQYLRRRTLIARSLVAVGVAVIVAMYGLPRSFLFAVQSHLSPDIHAADMVSLNYDPSLRTQKAAYSSLPAPPVLSIPIRIDPPGDAVLVIDFVDVRLLDVKGNLLKSNRVVPFNRPSETAIHLADGKAQQEIFQEVILDLADFNRLKNEAVRIELTYGLTQFRPSATSVIPASHTKSKAGTLGNCGSRPSASTDGSSDLNCFASAHSPSCLIIKVEPRSADNGFDIPWCKPNYAPAILKAGIASRPGAWVASYPTKAAQLPGAKLVLTAFEPEAHFTQRVVTPPLNIADFSEQPRKNYSP